MNNDKDDIGAGNGSDAEWETQTERRDPSLFSASSDADGPQSLIVDVEGFEGPLDLLLAMARTQKVDLARISVLALTEQYLAFIAAAQRLRLELAADYLVMAAWLAFLKSRLLLPREDEAGDQLSAEEMAQRLSFRLMRLEAMRNAAASLMTRHRLGRDVFARGRPDPIKRRTDKRFVGDLNALLRAYAMQRQRTIKVSHTIRARKVWSIKEARTRLQALIGASLCEAAGLDGTMWLQLDRFLTEFLPAEEERRTVHAASFGATLEMAREGLLDLRQDQPFGPIYMRQRDTETPSQ